MRSHLIVVLLAYVLIAATLTTSSKAEQQHHVKIKCNSSIPLGELRNVDSYRKTPSMLIEQLFRINRSNNHFSKIESGLERLISVEMHPFIGAVHLAYVNHLKLTITPDMIWNLIASGTANFINANSETLRWFIIFFSLIYTQRFIYVTYLCIRSKFVPHEGKRKITIRRDDFIFNSSANRWNEVINEFAQQVGKLTFANATRLFQADFTTTNEVSSVVSQIVLMDAMQKYFQFEFVSLCTIPELHVMGTTEDWVRLRNKTRQLNETIGELSVWYGKLEPLLNQFVNASQGIFDFEFWNQIYKGIDNN